MFEQLNQEKRKYEKGIILGIGITLFAFVMFIPVMIATGFAGAPIIIIPFFGGFIYAAKCSSKIKSLSMDFKEKYLQNELSKIIPDSTYKMYDGFSENEVVRSGLLRNEDRFSSEDMIIGTHHDVSFKCSDVLQQDVDRSKDKTRTRTVFHGRFYEFEFPRNLRSNIMILQPSLFNWGGRYEKVNTESIEFNSEIAVYAENPHDAFYLLTPHMMERVYYLDQKYSSRIRISIIENKLFIAINNGDSFDIRAFKTIDESIFYEYRREFEDIIEFIDVLRLDDTYFKGYDKTA